MKILAREQKIIERKSVCLKEAEYIYIYIYNVVQFWQILHGQTVLLDWTRGQEVGRHTQSSSNTRREQR